MTTWTEVLHPPHTGLTRRWGDVSATHYAVPVGRVLFALIFVTAGFKHFLPGTIAWAGSQGVPLAALLVPLSGLLAVIGGLSIAVGWQTRAGAAMVILFLVPVTLAMHGYWRAGDPAAAAAQAVHFWKNVAMLGGALLLLHHGGGPVSLDQWREGLAARGAKGTRPPGSAA